MERKERLSICTLILEFVPPWWVKKSNMGYEAFWGAIMSSFGYCIRIKCDLTNQNTNTRPYVFHLIFCSLGSQHFDGPESRPVSGTNRPPSGSMRPPSGSVRPPSGRLAPIDDSAVWYSMIVYFLCYLVSETSWSNQQSLSRLLTYGFMDPFSSGKVPISIVWNMFKVWDGYKT